MRKSAYKYFGKRIVDLITATIVFTIILPFSVFIGLAVWIYMGGSMFFRQERPGIFGKPFTIIKFRTMTNFSDENGAFLPDSMRLTKLGEILRSFSLDEIPTIWNIIKGDMSIVGPRPLLMEYLARYTPEQGRRHLTKPGITGWAQVSGRNAITWEEKFKLDAWYVDNISFWLDVKILVMTVGKVIRREGINQPGQATMEKFQGMR